MHTLTVKDQTGREIAEYTGSLMDCLYHADVTWRGNYTTEIRANG